MAQGMSRRHLFDRGQPVSKATLIAGSLVLLAVANEQVRKSRHRLGASLLQIADTSQRVMQSIALHVVNHGHESQSAPPEGKAGRSREPENHLARQGPHQP